MDLDTIKAKAFKLKSSLGLLYSAFKHRRTPWYAKALIALVISYALSPVDIIPDFIPVLGYLDDLILLPAGIALAIKLIPEDVLRECKTKQGGAANIKIKGIYAGISIILIWLIIICFLVTRFRSL